MSLPLHWIERIQKLPVLPQVALKVTERIQSPTATITEISDLIRSDIGLTSNILKLANSSYYSIPGGVTDVAKALQYLGFNTIAQSVLTASFFGAFKANDAREFPLPPFWAHSFAVGLLAEIAARSLQFKNPSDAFIGGLMHDLGKVVLLEIAPDDLSKIVRHAEAKKISFIQSEEELGFPSHALLGVEFGKYWKLPATVLSAIQNHHADSTSRDDLVVSWANLWVHAQKIGSSGNYSANDPQVLANVIAKKIGLEANKLTLIEKQFHLEFEKAGAILNAH